MSSEHMIRVRLTILFFTLLSLGVAGLSSANAHFAVILRDRARSDYINTSDGILDNKFQSVQSSVLINAVITAIPTTAFAIYGATIAVHPRWFRDHDAILVTYAILQVILAFAMIATGASLADGVHGYQTSFEKFGANDSIPYYSTMYYGGVAQAAYGSVLVSTAITAIILVCTLEHHGWKPRSAGEEPAPNYREKEGSQA